MTRAHAAPTGKIVGRVINQATHKGEAGVTVTLSRGTSSGTAGTEKTQTKSDGSYSFTGLKTGQDLFYAVDVEFQGGRFAGGVISLPSNTNKTPVVQTKLRVWPTTTDPQVIQLPRDDLFANQTGDTLGIIESVTVFNSSHKAYIGRGRENGGKSSTPSIAFSLPKNVALTENG
ncbi:MAG: hypothetical protein QOH90_88, partial [Actinomycetota bacterium]|nr:hypothetical protein [Actinomycetota bacterium]